MTVPRFHVPGIGPGARTTLPDHSAHHAREVLRLRAGALVHVFDGAGSEYAATLESVTRQAVSIRLGPAVTPRPESPLRISVALPPLKGDRMELAIQKMTELGVAAVWPVVTARTDAVGRPALTGSRQERWEKVASGAAEQCGRAVVPLIAPTARLDALLREPWPVTRLLLLETPGQPALAAVAPTAAMAVVVLIGPAGGWDAHEVEQCRGAGFCAVSLGPRVLRAETAAVAAVTALQVLWGDL